MDSHGRPACADGHTRTHTDRHGRPVCTEQIAHVGQNNPQSTGTASVLSPRTNVLICVLMDSHGRIVCADGHTQTATDVLCVLTDTQGRPVCADGHPQTSCTHTDTHGQPRTSCVCWRTPTDVLCVLNRQPTWAKITQTVHGKGQLKDQRADMCTDGQPRASTPRTHGHTRTATGVLCLLTDIHGHPVCADDTHGRPVCTEQTVPHGRHVCADGHTDVLPHGQNHPEPSTGRVSVLSPRTSVLICVLMDSHERPVCAGGHTADSHGVCVCWRTPTDGRLLCADGHPQIQPTWAKITKTVHGKGQRAESKDQRADMYRWTATDVMCVLTDTDGHTRTATDVLCVLADTHGRPPWTSCVHTQTATDVLCVLTDTHGRHVCTDQTAHVGQNHLNSAREGSAC
uniref:Uncharacterized protein n=1 Tax=Brassica campestris TaxID=3711 RepID=A0A3P5ZBH2_BRACM|nr:unnamed protein product [Brassica rapa]